MNSTSTTRIPTGCWTSRPSTNVWDVLKALRAHDEALGEELDELRCRPGAPPIGQTPCVGRVGYTHG